MAISDAERSKAYRKRLRKAGRTAITVYLAPEQHALMIDQINAGYELTLAAYIEHAVQRHAVVLERIQARKRSRSRR